MGIFELLVLLVVAGVALYLLNAFAPVDLKIKKLINVLVTTVLVLVVIWWFLGFFGFTGYGPHVALPRRCDLLVSLGRFATI